MAITRRLALVTLFASSLLSAGCHGKHHLHAFHGCRGCYPGFEAGYAAGPVGYAAPVAAPAAGCSSCYGGSGYESVPAPVYAAPPGTPYATPLPVPPGPPSVFQSSEPPAKMPEKK